MKHKTIFLMAAIALIFASCSNDSDDDLQEIPTDPTGPTGITYDGNIKSIMQNSCTGCHSSPPANGAPFALVNFSQVSSRSGAILNAMSRQSGAARAMPPSGRLPQTTIDLVEQWIEEGRKEN